jgi:hypothetical protein
MLSMKPRKGRIMETVEALSCVIAYLERETAHDSVFDRTNAAGHRVCRFCDRTRASHDLTERPPCEAEELRDALEILRRLKDRAEDLRRSDEILRRMKTIEE